MHFERKQWCEEARLGLSRTFHSDESFDAVKHIREGVERGEMELWLVDGQSWAVTQTWRDCQLLWCYQGRDVLLFAQTMLRVAERNGLRCIRFATRRKGLARLLAPIKPVLIEPPEVYEVGV